MIFYNTLVIASGYFGILHKGHIDYLEAAKKLGDILYVIVNNDQQLLRKKGTIIHSEHSRLSVVRSLKPVNQTILSIDKDESVNKTIARTHLFNHKFFKKIIFANGGDVHLNTIREYFTCRRLGIEIACAVGGSNKDYSTSNIIEKIKLC